MGTRASRPGPDVAGITPKRQVESRAADRDETALIHPLSPEVADSYPLVRRTQGTLRIMETLRAASR